MNKEDISLRASNNSNKKMRPRPADTTDNNNRNTYQQKPITLDLTPWNSVLNKLFRNFREDMFSESKFLVGISVLDTW